MDQLEEAFAGSLCVGMRVNDTATPHPRLSQFKQRGDKSSQDDRRRIKLESQKRDRLDYVNKARCLAEENWSNYEEQDEDEEDMDSGSSVLRKKRKPRYYRNQLMLSEWLVDVPTSLASDWLMVLCPEGKRNLIVAAKGKTSSYSKSGYRLSVFPSMLPGGCRKHKHNNTDYSLLDCIFQEATRTFYVLDIMCWRGHPVYDSDTEFRFYWLQTKLAEVPELAVQTSTNPYRFLALPSYPCNQSAIKDAMAKPAPFEYFQQTMEFASVKLQQMYNKKTPPNTSANFHLRNRSPYRC
ncbi:snurportin-1-like isoform X2 [Acanthaster planci]|uniref:Snurportin-1 n=1 Tax=Acanthaster planci TaxID=133434 RepID=A0A8B7ZX58_ACAPL|nr:snurportin-1-like isoform X2 [Acanthaster planci]